MQKLNESRRKRKLEILSIEADELNQRNLEQILSDEYQLHLAGDCRSGMELLRKNRERIVLVLLNMDFPDGTVSEFLRTVQRDPALASVPVVLITDDDRKDREEECIRMGAAAFIRKTYDPDLILSRIHNILRYRESLNMLAAVEFDELTGLYNMPAFCLRVGQFIADHTTDSDLIMMNLRDYAAINRTYGEKRSTELIRFIAQELEKLFSDALMARQDGSFYIWISSENDTDSQKLYEFCSQISISAPIQNVRLRVGIYRKVDREQPVSVLCDRAKLGMISAGNDGNVAIAHFNEELEEKWVQQQKLLMAFEPALKKREFQMYLQPKVEISTGKITAAEALVRWRSPDGKLIAPGKFIPMLEQEDLIRKLDEYMFREVCEYQERQRAEGKTVVPISVNLSRSSLFSEGIIEKYQKLAEEKQVDLSYVPLEITESALISDLQIQKICEAFVKAGFLLHIDDFGSGYSSMSSLASLPFSELKIDKSLIDNIGTEKGNLIIQNTIQIAQDLGMTVIAEGVEKENQVDFLREAECNLTQGFYYAAPMTTAEFEALVAQTDPYLEKSRHGQPQNGFPRMSSAELNRYLKSLSSVFSCIRILEPGSDEYSVVSSSGKPGEKDSPCYAIWKKHQHCENCTSRKAFETRSTLHKLETVEDHQYLVYSVYIEVDGKPKVIEMVSLLGQE